MTGISSVKLASVPFKRTFMKYYGVYRHIIIIFIILCRTKCQPSASVKDFYKIKQNSQVSTSNSFVLSRSLLECAQSCFPTQHCCGFNFNKLHKSCTFLYDFDFTYPNLKYETDLDTSVYILKTCDISEISSTSKDVPTTTLQQPAATTTTSTPPPTTKTKQTSSVINDQVRSTTISSKQTLTTVDFMTSTSAQPQKTTSSGLMTSTSTQPQTTTTSGGRMASTSSQPQPTTTSVATPLTTTKFLLNSEDSKNDVSKTDDSKTEDLKDSENEDSNNEDAKMEYSANSKNEDSKNEDSTTEDLKYHKNENSKKEDSTDSKNED